MKIFPIIFSIGVSASASSFIKRGNDQIIKSELQPFEYFMKLFLNFPLDMARFDFYGNELVSPDLSIPKDHEICIRTGNDSKIFRKFVGIIFNSESAINWDFRRIDQLKAHYYADTDKVSDADINESRVNHSNTYESRVKRNFPKVFEREYFGFEQLKLAEFLIVDLLLTLIPSIKGTLIDNSADLVGILVLIYLRNVKDFEEEYFEEFYGLMQKFASGHFFLLPSISNSRIPNRKILLEELFQLAVQSHLPYTLELFYALELVDFQHNSIIKFVLETAKCPLVINRFFDFISWNEKISGIPKIHYIYENYEMFLEMLFEYEASRIDWRVVDERGRTLLGRLLTSLSQGIFSEEHPEITNFHRIILKNFLSHVTPRESAGTFISSGEKDILMKCFENEMDGLRLLALYFDNCSEVSHVIENYLKRIIGKWKETCLINCVKVFKFLIKKVDSCDSKNILSILEEAFNCKNVNLELKKFIVRETEWIKGKGDKK